MMIIFKIITLICICNLQYGYIRCADVDIEGILNDPKMRLRITEIVKNQLTQSHLLSLSEKLYGDGISVGFLPFMTPLEMQFDVDSDIALETEVIESSKVEFVTNIPSINVTGSFKFKSNFFWPAKMDVRMRNVKVNVELNLSKLDNDIIEVFKIKITMSPGYFYSELRLHSGKKVDDIGSLQEYFEDIFYKIKTPIVEEVDKLLKKISVENIIGEEIKNIKENITKSMDTNIAPKHIFKFKKIKLNNLNKLNENMKIMVQQNSDDEIYLIFEMATKELIQMIMDYQLIIVVPIKTGYFVVETNSLNITSVSSFNVNSIQSPQLIKTKINLGDFRIKDSNATVLDYVPMFQNSYTLIDYVKEELRIEINTVVKQILNRIDVKSLINL